MARAKLTPSFLSSSRDYNICVYRRTYAYVCMYACVRAYVAEGENTIVERPSICIAVKNNDVEIKVTYAEAEESNVRLANELGTSFLDFAFYSLSSLPITIAENDG